MTTPRQEWSARAEVMQQELFDSYWNEQTAIMNQWYPRDRNSPGENFYYWWQAHVLDVLVDAWERSGDQKYIDRIHRLARGLRAYNGGTFRHNYYDDMEWTALALLRVYDHTGDEWYKREVLDLWTDIQSAWNDECGGGMAWKKDQLDYKNTPANAPAAILAARLYARFGEEEHLAWAVRIYEWNRDHLVDPDTGFVWDGMNRLGDSTIDKDWAFTYCQGVFIGAALELYGITGDKAYVHAAERTSQAALDRFVHPSTGMLPDEGIDDTGLFKGIFIRYIRQLIGCEADTSREWTAILETNGARLWESGRMPFRAIIGPSWEAAPELPVQLSVQLSGLMLLEALAGKASL